MSDIEICSQITNPKLVKVLKNLETNSKTEFINELFEAKFLCPVVLGNGIVLKNNAEKTTLGEDSAVQLIGLTSTIGKTYLMAFTDWNEFSKWNKKSGQKTLIFSYADYHRIILQGDSLYEGFVINPFSENIVLSKSFIKDISQSYQQAKKGESVMLGVPKDYPYDMEEALKKFFNKTKIVKQAYLLWMVKGDEAGYLLALDFIGSQQNVFYKVSDICRPYLNGKLLNIISTNTTFGKSTMENNQPFYQN